MAIPMSTAAYGAVVFGGLALFAIGHPAGEPPPSPTTPGLAAASTAPGTAVAAVAAAPAQPVSAGGFTLTSTQVTLPTSDRVFPPGPGMDVAQQNCTACHSVGMVLNQPKLSAAAWDGEVHKMLSVYKAPIDPAAMPAIVAYLASIQASR